MQVRQDVCFSYTSATRTLWFRDVSRHSDNDANRTQSFRRVKTRGGVIGLVALAAVLLAAGGVTSARLLGSSHGTGGPSGLAAIGTPGVTERASADSVGAAPAAAPQGVTGPQEARLPVPGSGHTAKPTPSKRPTAPGSASGSAGAMTGQPSTPAQTGGSGAGTPGGAGGSGGSTGSGGSGGSASVPPPPAGSTSCASPKYTTSDPDGMWNQDPYFVANDAWNSSNYSVSQTLSACSYSNWYVRATMDNSKGDGAVKTYPNAHRDFSNSPAISSFSSITSTFAETSPGTGIYEDAYDIWLNGIGGDNATEVMIWTDNHGQVPSGSAQGTVTVGGRTYTAYKTSGNYIAFVPSANFTSGSMDLLAFFKWIMSKGWIGSNATLGQVDYGVELVSTNGAPATFSFSNFTVNAS